MHRVVVCAFGISALAVLSAAGCGKGTPVRHTQDHLNNMSERAQRLERAAKPSGEFEAAASSMDIPTQPSASAIVNDPSWVKPTPYDVQFALKNAGFYRGNIDAKIGPKTREAIKAFQHANALKADGIVGRQTWEKLNPFLEGPPETQSAAVEPAEAVDSPEK